MTEKRFKVAVYDENAINGFAVLDLDKPNISKRLKYENVYVGSKEGCEIVCKFGNALHDENEQLKEDMIFHLQEIGSKHEIEKMEEKYNFNYSEELYKADTKQRLEMGLEPLWRSYYD